MGEIVVTTDGQLRGVSRNEVQAFLGVPFAAPPIGALRFRAPAPATKWEGVRDADEFGPACPQPESPLPGMAAGPQEEAGCLTLNVFTPECDDRARPVMVWIHGGACITGSSRQLMYDGAPLVRRGDVVVVTINYRLGILGWLVPGEKAEGFAANAGLLDQIAALRWVQENIRAFGGDPENVTIFGESAGGMSVTSLLAAPAATGLFQKAIPQSGAAQATLTLPQAAEAAEALCQELGLASLDPEQLQDVPVDDLLAAQVRATETLQADRVLTWAPVVDGKVLPEHPLAAIARGVAREVPVLVGSTADEWRLFTIALPGHQQMSPESLRQRVAQRLKLLGGEQADVDQALALYPGMEPWQAFDAIETDRVFWMPAIRLAQAQLAHQPQTFMYRFSWPSPAAGGLLGACHAIELAFVFGTLDTPGMDRFSGAGAAAEVLAGQVMDAWVAFAHEGDPGHAGLPTWEPYDAQGRKTMDLGENSQLISDPEEERRIFWAKFLKD